MKDCRRNGIGIGARGLGFDSRGVQIKLVSPATRTAAIYFRSLALCCPGAQLRKWTPPLVTRLDVMPLI